MNRSRRIVGSISVLSRSLASRVRRKNHYDSLEVDSKATQGEIKSAYFKLTMQYHPDKNSSEEAKVKFRDIIDAYDVLGNYQKRRQYDRGLQIKTDTEPRQPGDPKVQDITKEAARVRSAIYRQSSEAPGSSRMYDFDRWTKAHYGSSFKKTWAAKENARRFNEERESVLAAQAYEAIERFILFMVIVVLGGTMGIVTVNHTFDSPVAEQNSVVKEGEKQTERT
ncbi:dnaJ homolog subfamily C member 30 [Fopius arisanus]|uniref:DnaJ homolog subfamily C member 30 n=2 Tax=Fopius arisanus TaxID=64838 RepID=A0A9R1T745_9HYME|nr:PREDICTED: dnaJ homolog subfamily C member 30 [Fopius arisanus]